MTENIEPQEFKKALKIQALTIFFIFPNFIPVFELKSGLFWILCFPSMLATPVLPIINLGGMLSVFLIAKNKKLIIFLCYFAGFLLSIFNLLIWREGCAYHTPM